MNKITTEHVDNIIAKSDIVSRKFFDKCLMVTVKLPNGFVIVESSSCVDPKNYDFDIGYSICINKVKDKVWELEGYRLQCKLSIEQ